MKIALVYTVSTALALIAKMHNVLPSQVDIVGKDGQSIVPTDTNPNEAAKISLADLYVITGYARSGQKLQAVNLVRQITACSLKEAKDYVDSLAKNPEQLSPEIKSQV